MGATLQGSVLPTRNSVSINSAVRLLMTSNPLTIDCVQVVLKKESKEPSVAINTVADDLGIKQAQDDYQRLMNNKSPKNKRK